MRWWTSLEKVEDFSMNKRKFIALLLWVLVGGPLLGGAIAVGYSRAASSDLDIRGVWRPATVKDCSGAQLFIEDTEISVASKAVERVPIDFDVVIFNAPHAVGPVLLLHPRKQPFNILMLVQTELADGELSFGEAVWSEPAIAAFGDALNSPPFTTLVENMKRGNPYRRCPS
jgi:hypothetical protein